jgi:hypothetical protein
MEHIQLINSKILGGKYLEITELNRVGNGTTKREGSYGVSNITLIE